MLSNLRCLKGAAEEGGGLDEMRRRGDQGEEETGGERVYQL